jgi:UDP-N-acetylglucosamine acyltransferase
MKIHPTAIVHPEAQVDPSVEIGPWCTVGPKVKLGRGTRLISHVVIDGWTEMGEDNLVFPFAVLGAVPQDLKYRGEDTRLIVGDKNTFRESVTVNLGTVQGGGITRMGDSNLLMAYSHLGHDTVMGNHCVIANSGNLGGHVVLEDYVTVGGVTGVVQFIHIGAYAYIASSSSVDRDIPPFSVSMPTRPTTLKGANIVGLKRRGFSSEVIQKLNDAIKLWSSADLQKDQCLLEIEAQSGDCAEVQRLVTFIRKSESGVAR